MLKCSRVFFQPSSVSHLPPPPLQKKKREKERKKGRKGEEGGVERGGICGRALEMGTVALVGNERCLCAGEALRFGTRGSKGASDGDAERIPVSQRRVEKGAE